MKILFLDDNPRRWTWFMMNGVSREDRLWWAATAQEAIDHLALHSDGLDLVHLDHDLGDETFVDSARKDCGMEVVRWIVANKPTIGRIVSHTMNTPAGHEMVRLLKEAGYSARYRSFYRMVHDPLDIES